MNNVKVPRLEIMSFHCFSDVGAAELLGLYDGDKDEVGETGDYCNSEDNNENDEADHAYCDKSLSPIAATAAIAIPVPLTATITAAAAVCAAGIARHIVWAAVVAVAAVVATITITTVIARSMMMSAVINIPYVPPEPEIAVAAVVAAVAVAGVVTIRVAATAIITRTRTHITILALLSSPLQPSDEVVYQHQYQRSGQKPPE